MDDSSLNIIWEQVTDIEAMYNGRLNYIIPDAFTASDNTTVLAQNVTDLIISMNILQPKYVYFYKVTVGNNSEFIQLNVMPPLILNMGEGLISHASIREDTYLTIRDVFAFPSYLEDNELTTDYEWSWSCTQDTDGRGRMSLFHPTIKF